MEKEIKKQITTWLKSNQDYNSGLALLIQVCKNRVLVRNLSRNNTPKNIAKIAAELRKAAGMNVISKPVADVKKKTRLSDSSQETYSVVAKAFAEKVKTYPAIIQKLIKQIGDLYSKREKHHFELKKVPELNTPENISSRKAILDKIIFLSDHLEHLNKFKTNFLENKIVPTEDEIKFTHTKPAKNNKSKSVIAKMTEAELVRRLNNLRTNLSKKKNKLLYQHVSKQKEENPMPEGSRRDQLLKQIKSDQRSIEKIQKRLDDFAKNK